MIGLPFAGRRTLFVDIIRTRASKLRFQRQRHVHGHLVAVKVRVKRSTDQRVQLNCLAFDQHRLKRLDAKTVKRWRTVQQHGMLADNLIEDIPDFGRSFSTSFLACFTVEEYPLASRRA